MFKVLATGIVTAILVSAFWIFFYGITGAPAGEDKVTAAGEKVVVDPQAQPPVTLAEGIVVGPAGLAIPVQGVKPAQLVDTYTQARAGGARTHDAIDIMASEGTPVVAAADGTVEKLFLSQGGGGITVYVRSPDSRWKRNRTPLSLACGRPATTPTSSRSRPSRACGKASSSRCSARKAAQP